MNFKHICVILCLSMGTVAIPQDFLETICSSDVLTPVKPKLVSASQSGDLETVITLLKSGVDVDVTDVYDKTALIRAVENGNIQIVYELLYDGANPNQSDRWDKTALMYATHIARDDYPDIIKELLDYGANVNAVDKDNKTALIWLVTWKEGDGSQLIKLLVDAGADTEIVEDSGRTALMLAVEDSNKHHVTALIKAKANVNAINRIDDNRTVLMYAINTAALMYTKSIEESRSREFRNHNFYKHKQGMSLEIVIELLATGLVDLDLDEQGKTALMYAKDIGYVKMVNALIAAGASDVD